MTLVVVVVVEGCCRVASLAVPETELSYPDFPGAA